MKLIHISCAEKSRKVSYALTYTHYPQIMSKKMHFCARAIAEHLFCELLIKFYFKEKKTKTELTFLKSKTSEKCVKLLKNKTKYDIMTLQ